MKQSKLDFKPKKAAGSPKKKKAKKDWSGDDFEEHLSSDLDNVEPSRPVRTISRRSAGEFCHWYVFSISIMVPMDPGIRETPRIK